MKITMIVDVPFISVAVQRMIADHGLRYDQTVHSHPWAVDSLSHQQSVEYVTSSKFAEEEVSLRGIQSTWKVTDIDDGRYLVEIDGPRHSLVDWAPACFLSEAQRQWEDRTLLQYETWTPERGPTDVGISIPMVVGKLDCLLSSIPPVLELVEGNCWVPVPKATIFPGIDSGAVSGFTTRDIQALIEVIPAGTAWYRSDRAGIADSPAPEHHYGWVYDDDDRHNWDAPSVKPSFIRGAFGLCAK